MKKQKLHPEKELPDFLEKRRKENPFLVPYNYFKELPQNINRRVDEELEKEKSSSLLFRLNEFWDRLYSPSVVMIVSAIIVLLIAIPVIINKNSRPGDDFGLSAEEIALYIEANIDEFEEELFYTIDPDQVELFPELEMEEEQLELIINDLLQEIEVEALEEML